MNRRKVLSLILTLVMVGATMLPIGLASPSNAASVTDTANWTKLSGSTAGQTIGTNGKTSYYYLNGNVTCTNSNAGGSGLSIAAGATVYIYIPYGYTLNCTGHASSGTTGGGAGILLPSGSTLYLVGSGTVKATGGDASKGTNGENGVSSVYSSWDAVSTSGAGGNGGGGAGAGIGTAGGTGGNGGGRKSLTQHIYDDGEYNGAAGNNGAAGTSANNAGNLYVSGVNITNVKGGQAAADNTTTVSYSGTARQYWYNSGTKMQQYYYIGGAGGGGNGGSGVAGNNIGPGGPGGGGGGSGGTGGMSWSDCGANTNYYYYYGGHGGKGGKTYNSANSNVYEWGKAGKIDKQGGDYTFPRGGNGGNGYGSGATKSAKSANTTTNPSFTVKYNNLDGTTTNANYVVNNDSKITLKDCPGCKWRMDKYGKSCGNNSTLCTNTSELFEGNTTLDAINVYGNLEFSAVPNEYTVSLDANGGSAGDSSFAVTYGDAIPTIQIPTKGSNYIFNGYWDEGSDEKIFDSLGNLIHEKFDFVENLELKACWERTWEELKPVTVSPSVSNPQNFNSVTLSVNKIDGTNLNGFYERTDTLSHNLYYEKEIIDATDDTISIDVKPMDQASEHGVLSGEPQEIPVENGKEVQFEVKLPDAMAEEAIDNEKIYVRHIKEDGTIYNIDAEDIVLRSNGKVKFKDDHGFSVFEISTEPFTDPEFAGKSLTLSSNLGANFYMDIPERYLESGTGTMSFKVNGTDAGTVEGVYESSNNKYKFTCKLNALQMADRIEATYKSADNTYILREEYSVLDYLNWAYEKSADKNKRLAYAVHLYGHYAQQYLSQHNDFTLGEDYAILDKPQGKDVNTNVDLSKFAKVVTNNGNASISEAGLSLVLDDEVALKFHLVLTDGTYEPESITIDGVSADSSMISKNGNTLEITINAISSTKLGKNFKLVVDGNYTVEASALSYAYSLYNKTPVEDNAKELAAALYEYYAASMNYIGESIE